MPLKIIKNVAEYKRADWANFVKKVSNTTPESAKRIAMADYKISCFFHCRKWNWGQVLLFAHSLNPRFGYVTDSCFRQCGIMSCNLHNVGVEDANCKT